MIKIFIILILIFFSGFSHSFPVDIGDKSPKFANPDLSGEYILSKNVIGKGWVIIDFFATDCEPCKKEIIELEEILAEYEEKGLEILVFATDQEGRYTVKPFFEEHPTSLLIVIDRYKVAASKFGVDEIPTVFLIDPHGTVALKAKGYKKEALSGIKKILLKAFE